MTLLKLGVSPKEKGQKLVSDAGFSNTGCAKHVTTVSCIPQISEVVYLCDGLLICSEKKALSCSMFSHFFHKVKLYYKSTLDVIK